jgi:hypothetical protein
MEILEAISKAAFKIRQIGFSPILKKRMPRLIKGGAFQ